MGKVIIIEFSIFPGVKIDADVPFINIISPKVFEQKFSVASTNSYSRCCIVNNNILFPSTGYDTGSVSATYGQVITFAQK